MQPIYLIQFDLLKAEKLKKDSKSFFFYPSKNKNHFFLSTTSLKTLRKQKVPFNQIKKFDFEKLPVKIVYPLQSSLFDKPHPEAIEEITTYALSKQKERKKIYIYYLGRNHHSTEGTILLDRPGGKRSYCWKISSIPKKVEDIRHAFPKIVAKIKDPNTRVILSFGGGGLRMFAHPALMKFLEILFTPKEIRKYISEIWGSSGGAMAGMFYAMGVEPIVMEELGYHFYNERYSLDFNPNPLEILKNMILDSVLPTADNLLKGYANCQEAIRKVLHQYVSKKSHRSKLPFYCIAYNLKERRNEVLTTEKISSNGYPIPIRHTNAIDAVIASSSIPILYVPKKILRGKTEHLYIDGGTTEEIPLVSVYQKWVYDKLLKKEKRKKLLIIAVNLFPEFGKIKLLHHWLLQKLPPIRLLQLSATFVDLMRRARIDEQKGHLKDDKNVTLLELHLPLPGAGILNAKLIPTIIETAHRSFLGQLLEMEKKL